MDSYIIGFLTELKEMYYEKRIFTDGFFNDA